MKSSERINFIAVMVFVLILVVMAGFLFNGFEISGKAISVIDNVKTKYFSYEQEIVTELEHVEKKIEVGAYEFYYGVDKIEQDIVREIEEFAKSVELELSTEIEYDDSDNNDNEDKEINWDEVCEEVLIGLNECFSNSVSANDCGVQISVKLNELFDLDNNDILEVEDRCLN